MKGGAKRRAWVGTRLVVGEVRDPASVGGCGCRWWRGGGGKGPRSRKRVRGQDCAGTRDDMGEYLAPNAGAPPGTPASLGEAGVTFARRLVRFLGLRRLGVWG